MVIILRFHKIVWSPLGINGAQPNGVIAAGCEGGHLQVYSTSKLLAGEDALLASQDKHTGKHFGQTVHAHTKKHYKLMNVFCDIFFLILNVCKQDRYVLSTIIPSNQIFWHLVHLNRIFLYGI